MEVTTVTNIIYEICKKRGESHLRKIEYHTLDAARKNAHQKYTLIVVDKEGNHHPYMLNGMRFDNIHRNIIAVKFIEERLKNFNDLGIVPKFVKNVKICEGGGWYSKGALYEVEGMYYEC